MRGQPLSAVKAGISRLRDKGGASTDSLFDLVNGYVTASRTIRSRPGSVHDHQLPAGTKGLVLFRGKFVVFSSEPADAGSPDYQVEVLKHPDPDLDVTIDDVRFAVPFLGYLYVVVRWSNGDIVHYWLQGAVSWEPNKVYLLGDIVAPSVPTGLVYRATRLLPADPVWTAGAPRIVGDRVEPTEFNGYRYEVIETIGDARSGSVEPKWNTGDGAITYEDVDIDGSTNGGVGGDGSTNTPPADVRDRYSNPAGQFPDGSTTQVQ